MKRKIITLTIVSMFLLNLSGCSSIANLKQKIADKKNEKTSTVKIEESKETESTETNDSKNESDSLDKSSSEKSTSKEGTQRIGQSNYGFVDIPSNWVKFKDVDVSSDSPIMQYSDVLGRSIITLSYIANNTQDIELIAGAQMQRMQNDGVQPTGARTKLDKYDAIQVYGYYESKDIMFVTWYFVDENKGLHYVSIEGPKNELDTIGRSVQGTYSLSE